MLDFLLILYFFLYKYVDIYMYFFSVSLKATVNNSGSPCPKQTVISIQLKGTSG